MQFLHGRRLQKARKSFWPPSFERMPPPLQQVPRCPEHHHTLLHHHHCHTDDSLCNHNHRGLHNCNIRDDRADYSDGGERPVHSQSAGAVLQSAGLANHEWRVWQFLRETFITARLSGRLLRDESNFPAGACSVHPSGRSPLYRARAQHRRDSRHGLRSRQKARVVQGTFQPQPRATPFPQENRYYG